jgi:hypothetical protein
MAFAKDYKDVATRLAEIRIIYPELSLQQVRCELIDQGGQLGWLYVAAAFRTPDDLRPGMGTAFEPVPGKTPYTKDSELMVAETSAWGRALVAIGADTKNGVASADEVKARSKPQEPVVRDFVKDAEYNVSIKNLDGLRGVYKDAVRHARPQAELDIISMLGKGLEEEKNRPQQ